MPTPLAILAVHAPAGSKLVAALVLPAGLTTAPGTTVAGGTVPGTTTVPTGSAAVYAGLAAAAGDPESHSVILAVGGTPLPDTADAPYRVEVRSVPGGTVTTSYAALAAAFAAGTWAAGGTVPDMLAGHLRAGAWVSDSPSGYAAIAAAVRTEMATELARIDAPVSGVATLATAIKGRTDLITSAGVTVTGPVNTATGNRLNLVAGDGYEVGARVPTWSFPAYAGPSLAGATARLRLAEWNAYTSGGSAPAAAADVAAAVAMEGGTAVFRAPLTEADTAALRTPPGGPAVTHKYQLVATTAGGEDVTLLLGDCRVTRRINPAPT